MQKNLQERSNKGISLISLIITIIVIILLATIVIFTGLNTPDSAQFANFTQQVDNVQMAVTNKFADLKAKHSIEGRYRTDEQIYLEIATGEDHEMDKFMGITEDNLKSTSEESTGIQNITVLGAQNKEHSIGMILPKVRESNTAWYVTKEGRVFNANGYEYDGKTYFTGEVYQTGVLVANDTTNDKTAEVIYSFISRDENVVSGATRDGSAQAPTGGAPTVATLPTGTGTTPYYPSSSFKQLPRTTLATGLVITDAVDPTDSLNPGNEYVWIEVPTTGGPNYSAVANKTEGTDDYYSAIEEALIAYAGFAKTGDDYKITKLGWKDEYYNGCGLTRTEYTNLYHAMLDSVYKNGGFWIGRYEAGTSTARGSETDSINNLIPTSKVNQFPFNYVTCSQAQTLASRIATSDANNNNNYHSSIMFGVQWDLVIKYLETSSGIWDTTGGKTATDYLKVDSSIWGNYYNQPFDIDRGKYAIVNPWKVFKDYTTATANKVTVTNGVSRKIGTTSTNQILLTTGASDTNSKKNIYDLAGNVYEWTLEHATSSAGAPCAGRGGVFSHAGYNHTASIRGWDGTAYSGFYYGFRSSLY